MRAITQDAYGVPEEVLRLRDVAKPEVGDGEVLVRVRGAAVSGSDWHILRGLPYAARSVVGVRRPRNTVPGLEMAGTVEAVGPGVTGTRVGDEVFGWCSGAFCEYVAVPEGQVTAKPANLTAVEAAAVPIAGFTALQAVRDAARVRAGQKVLVLGASGCVGTYAVQLAKHYGAEVTGVCSAAKADLVTGLGADHVLDYAAGPLTASGFDVVIDLYGNPPLRTLKRLLKQGGTVVLAGGTGGRWLMGTDRWIRGLVAAPFLGIKVRPLVHKDRLDDLVRLRELIEAGAVRPALDRTYPLDEAAAAIEDVRRGRVRGHAVVTP
ncbi:NADPH:quinone reductase-like Zn-dependent oxidoreductase [Saccharothrix carnea]|uniref:NADPH:quinone reductase-like Zn-dependent oxidoreductase n=1 Tax=Saccharothrix carnea TaxID=1280637 RepID=A0A2P8IAN5_SACCR|nr:NAD(P)-dependent alcohol dehydrogenase [Saccharothrix carnea]PSL55534.1 NADPH:quinone reductase-like Zn-dependent oxidoreductase [Saccharothrix carnea]